MLNTQTLLVSASPVSVICGDELFIPNVLNNRCVITDTTRQPREGEQNGKDYHFVTKESMIKEVEEGKFIESATFSGNMYGECSTYAVWNVSIEH